MFHAETSHHTFFFNLLLPCLLQPASSMSSSTCFFHVFFSFLSSFDLQCQCLMPFSRHDHPLSSTHDHPPFSTHDHPLSSTHDHPPFSTHDHPLSSTHDHPLSSTHDHPLSSTHDHPLSSTHDHPLSSTHDHPPFSRHDHPLSSTHDLTNEYFFPWPTNLLFHSSPTWTSSL